MNILITSCQEFDAQIHIYGENGTDRVERLPANGEVMIENIMETKVRLEFRAADETENPILEGLEYFLGYIFCIGFLLVLEEELEETFEKEGFWGAQRNFVYTVIEASDGYQGEILAVRYEDAGIMRDCNARCNVGILTDDLNKAVKVEYEIKQKSFWKMFREVQLSVMLWAVIICGGISIFAYKVMGVSALTIILPIMFLPTWGLWGLWLRQKKFWKEKLHNFEMIE